MNKVAVKALGKAESINFLIAAQESQSEEPSLPRLVISLGLALQ